MYSFKKDPFFPFTGVVRPFAEIFVKIKVFSHSEPSELSCKKLHITHYLLNDQRL